MEICEWLSLSFSNHCSLRVSAIFDHFGYPPPHLDQWQQHVWYNLGAAQELLHQMRTHLARGLPTAASPQRADPPLSLHKPASKLIPPLSGEGNLLRLPKAGDPTLGAATARPSPSTVTTSPKTETKRKKKRKTTKRTVTSETVSPPEKKVKLISESPDSKAVGSFQRLGPHWRVYQRTLPTPSSGRLFINSHSSSPEDCL